MSEEIFVPISGYEHYEISNKGTVRILFYPTSNGLVRRKEPMVKQPVINKQGYLRTSLSRNNTQHMFFIHRLVAYNFLGISQKARLVRHIDGDKLNNTPENLAYGSQKENIADAKLHGTLKGVAVIGFYKDGRTVVYDYTSDAAKDGLEPSCISACIAGRQKTHDGAVWMRLGESALREWGARLLDAGRTKGREDGWSVNEQMEKLRSGDWKP